MGGGEGSTARELLRHKTVENVAMCDIDEVNFHVLNILVIIRAEEEKRREKNKNGFILVNKCTFSRVVTVFTSFDFNILVLISPF